MNVVLAVASEVVPFALILCLPVAPEFDVGMSPVQPNVPSRLAVALQMLTDDGLESPVS